MSHAVAKLPAGVPPRNTDFLINPGFYLDFTKARSLLKEECARKPRFTPDRVYRRYLKSMKELRNQMMKKISFAAFAFAVAMLIAAPVAMATTVSEVQSMITQLKGKVQIIPINGKFAETKDRPGLLGQLDGVALTLDQGKFCDSVTKVRDFQKKVNQMISADNKINQDPTLGPTAQELLADGDSIITALNELATQSKGSGCF
jgi:hypothetical protein